MPLLLTVQFWIHQCYCRVSLENKHYLLTYLQKHGVGVVIDYADTIMTIRTSTENFEGLDR